MVRSNGLCTMLHMSERKECVTSSDVLWEFRVMHSSNQGRRQEEDLVMSNLSTALFMLEGIVSVPVRLLIMTQWTNS